VTVAQRFVPGEAPARRDDKPDLDSPARIEEMVDRFYQRVLDDPLIAAYWKKMLLGDTAYDRHMIAKHRAVHDKQPLTGAHHERWLALFTANLQEHFSGPNTDRARLLAARVMDNLYRQLSQR
jgi:hemoglobin